MILKKVFLIILFFSVIGSAQSVLSEHGRFSESGFVEYLPGNIPLIISVPHDGEKLPAAIPDRSCDGDIHTVADRYTQEMSMAIRKAFFDKTGKLPFVIINHLRRKKVDVNRDIQEAACGGKTAELVWEEYHSYVDSAKEEILKYSKKGFYIDLHAHNHVEQFLELGYLLDAEELQLDNKDLEDDLFIDKSSLRNLVTSIGKKQIFTELISGPSSIGSLLEAAGYPTIPSTTDRAPVGSQPFFRGGYSLNRHSSANGGTFDGIQIETNMENVRDGSRNINKFAGNLTEVLVKFLEHYYGFHIKN